MRLIERPTIGPGRPRGRALTRRETQVLELLAAGLTTAQAAARLGMARGTCDRHALAAMQRLGVHDRAALIAAWRVTEGT